METTAQGRRVGVAFALLAAPFYLNDFANLLVRDWRLWLTIDYVFLKVVPLAVILWLVRTGRMRAADFGWSRMWWLHFLLGSALLTLVGMLLDQNGYMLVKSFPGYAPLGGMPRIQNATWNWIDLTVGLALVALMEETIFRGLAATLLTQHFDLRGVIGLSGVAFGLIHWSLGWHSVVVTGAIGAAFMFFYLRFGSIAPSVVAHFVVNFIDFAGVIPRGQLQFL